MKNTLINKKVVAVIAGSIMSLSSFSFSTGIFVAGAVIVMPSTAHAKRNSILSKKVERQMRKAERLEEKAKKADEKWKATQKKEFEKESKSGVIANCGAPGQLPCN